jgi:hypothetical protein
MYEPIVSIDIVNKLLPYTIHMYLQNNIYDNPLIHTMPIGIRDGEEICPNHKHFTHKYLIDESKIEREKEYLCLLCFSSENNPDRYLCEKYLENKNFILNLNNKAFEKQPSIHCGKVPVWINYEYTHKSYYVLSPFGCGVDCHRFYEALYLDSIPIVKKTNTAFDKLYNIFPCLVINEWNEITQELLENNKDKLMNKLFEFKNKYNNFFYDLRIIEVQSLAMKIAINSAKFFKIKRNKHLLSNLIYRMRKNFTWKNVQWKSNHV